MSALGLGCVKTPASPVRVEESRGNCASGKSNLTVHRQLDAVWENCILYILPMYEFSHKPRSICDMAASSGHVRSSPNTGHWSGPPARPLSATSGHRARG